MRIRISSDSTCDLSRDYLLTHQVELVPLYTFKGGKTFRDGVDITPTDIFEHVAAGGDLCSTAANNVEDYHEVFSRLLEDCDAVIHITISLDFSSCYQNACIAARDFPGKVFPVDSRNLSTGIGHLVLDAADMAAEGKLTAQEIVDLLNEKKAKLDVSFVLDTLEFLKAGGRCSAVAAFGANLLGLKPSIEVKDGGMGVGKKYRGNINKCYVQYIRDRLSNRDDIDTKRIFITDSGLSEAVRAELEEVVRSCQPFEEVHHTQAGCTVSQHCGPGCMGILYYHK